VTTTLSGDWTTAQDLETWQRRPNLIIGQAPARSAGPHTRPWDSASGRLLARRAGTTIAAILAICDTTNLNLHLRGTKGKWDVFDMAEATHRTLLLIPHLHRWSATLICGAKPARLLGVPINATEGPTWAIVHPGGTNVHLNDPANLEAHTRTIQAWWQACQQGR
jgi:hypothetical protein